MADTPLQLTVKWSGREFIVSLLTTDTVSDLRDALCVLTGVQPQRQKLLNLRPPPPDTEQLGTLKLPPKIMMMGSVEEDIERANAACTSEANVVDDLDEAEDGEEVPLPLRPENEAKVARRVRNYKVDVKNALRPGKKLLVLDIDYTLFDHRSVADCGSQLMRPFLHEFLTAAYRHYDIVIWSATSMKWIDEKMRLLGVSGHADYRIAFHLDSLAMITVHSERYGVVQCKPLAVIWGLFPEQTSPQNTIMFDDVRHNFLMNKQNGLRIRPFRQAHQNRATDTELLLLAQYLASISRLDTLAKLNHGHWEQYLQKHPPPSDT